MIHSFELLGMTLYPFWLCALAGAALFAVCAWRMAKKIGETRYIMPKLLFASYAGLLGALAYDTLFKFIENGAFTFGGISFYGGLISGAFALFMLLRRDSRSALTPEEWLDKLTIPFMAFHFCGRIGCFLGGCCYGKPTESVFGVYFPDIPEENIFHNGEKCLPTQLFEAAAILVCAALIATLLKKRRFINYLILYPVCRFIIEFWRGDDRGATGFFLSPSQLVSLMILVIPAVYYAKKIKSNKGSA